MSWFSRLKQGLSKTSGQLSEGISDIFTRRRLDDEALEALEDVLIAADVGTAAAGELIQELAAGRFDKDIGPQEVQEALADIIARKLEPVARPLDVTKGGHRPHVVLVVGVNGNGKTTTIGKLAHDLKEREARSEARNASSSLAARPAPLVMLAAADTFRAAAVDQLMLWGERVGCEVVTGAEQADPASVAYMALERAREQQADVLLIDTAGRLHNKANLMEELKKIVRVLQKLDASAPHSVVQVLDGTTGQNALQQVEAFRALIDVTGLVVTKLDGTARAGVVVALAERFALPIHAVGVGEGVDDLQPFDPGQFARGLVGLNG